ncbi:MAG: NAD-dependent isocitrate dehydrogenase [Acidimicrobiia bacterium]|nr:NAD-dependent isocitrate dehydrogenase [Acidimicrobiia bacterium]
MKTAALIVSGGIAQEITPPVLRIIEAAGADIDWDRHDIIVGPEGPIDGMLEPAISAVREHGVALKTKLIAPNGWGPRGSLNVTMRQRLDQYAGVYVIKSIAGLSSRFPELDLVLIRENTEDIYKSIEHEVVDGVVESIKIVTEKASERIARFAFFTAKYLGRKKVTFIHKANIMKMSDGLFMNTVRRVAAEHPEFEYEETIVDAACMKLVLNPYQFDVMLMGNLYGAILSNLCNGLTGGISSSMGIHIGDDTRIYESTHGDAAHLVGTGLANPLPLLIPAIDMLRWVKETEAADAIHSALEAVLEQGSVLTQDLGGTATTEEVADAIIRNLDT